MTRYQRIAKKAIAVLLARQTEPVLLFHVSCWADEAARQRGKVRDLYDSLWDYEHLLPEDWTVKMLKTERPLSDALAMAVPRSWKPGVSQSTSLLLGSGSLIEAKQGDLNL
jgi:hypothetical protein